jgi:2-beta-glucuronyltransferase
MSSLRRVLIVTGQHFASAPRKVDLHFIAEALQARGVGVDFLSWRLSPVSRFLNDGRWAYARQRPHNCWVASGAGEEFIWVAPLHPLNLRRRWLNVLTAPLFSRFGRLLPAAVVERLAQYSHVLIESGPSPLLAERIHAAAPDAAIIYHAADRLSTIDVHPCIEAVLARSLPLYCGIHIMAEALRSDFPVDAPVFYLPHGISRKAFDEAEQSPYTTARNAVSVGDMLFDAQTVSLMARAFPDWTFHLFGKQARLAEAAANVIAHGEVAFGEIVAYIKFADIGLAPYLAGASADYLAQSSLKMIQYTYCRLPIVAPEFAAAGRGHVLAYLPGDAGSTVAAFERAIAFDRNGIDRSGVLDWGETAERLFAVDNIAARPFKHKY